MICGAQLFGGLTALLQVGIPRFAGQRKFQVRAGIFVPAIRAGGIGQFCQAPQGLEQEFGRAFEISAASGAEQRVSAKDDYGGDKGDMVIDVTRNLDDVEDDAKII